MLSPNATQNMRIGIDVSVKPVAVKPSRSAPLPSWNTHTMKPNTAVRLSVLSTIAFNGTSSDPNIKNSRTKVDTTIIAPAIGTRREDRLVRVDERR